MTDTNLPPVAIPAAPQAAPANAGRFNFNDLDITVAAGTPYEFELEHPLTREGLGVFISVIGAESEKFQGYLRAEGNRDRQKQLDSKRKGQPADLVTLEEEEESLLRALAVCIVGWRTETDGKSEPTIEWGSDHLALTPDNAVRWLKQFRWAREQVNTATGDLTHFLPSK